MSDERRAVHPSAIESQPAGAPRAGARGKATEAPRQARRPWLGGARQAGRHDLDARGRGDPPAVHAQDARAMPARSIRWPPAACRSRSARRPRPCRSSWTRPRPIASPCAGARNATPTMPKAASSKTSDVRPTAAADRGHPAALHRRDRAGAAALFRDQDRRRTRL